MYSISIIKVVFSMTLFIYWTYFKRQCHKIFDSITWEFSWRLEKDSRDHANFFLIDSPVTRVDFNMELLHENLKKKRNHRGYLPREIVWWKGTRYKVHVLLLVTFVVPNISCFCFYFTKGVCLMSMFIMLKTRASPTCCCFQMAHISAKLVQIGMSLILKKREPNFSYFQTLRNKAKRKNLSQKKLNLI